MNIVDKKVTHAETFRQEIQQLLNDARTEGKTYVDIVSRDVHQRVVGYPSKHNRMPTCCNAMYAMMKPTDKVMEAPPKGKGSTLKIRYYL